MIDPKSQIVSVHRMYTDTYVYIEITKIYFCTWVYAISHTCDEQ